MGMTKVSDSFTPFLANLKSGLEVLNKSRIAVGVQGVAGKSPEGDAVEAAPADLRTIAAVHEYGATIRARNVKNLAIPIHKKAKGKSPRDFPGLFFLHSDSGFLFGCIDGKHHNPRKINPSGPGKFKPKKLSEEDTSPLPKKQGGITFLFLLLPSVTIPERSFLRAGMHKSKEKLRELLRAELSGMGRGEKSPELVLDYVGGSAAGFIRSYIDDPGHFKAKSKVTKAVSNWPDKPLMENARLRNSVSFVVEEK